MTRVLLLGGTGFIGASVLDVLRRRPETQTLLLAHRRIRFAELEDVDLVVGDLSRFDPVWLDAFQPDTVIHLARLGGRGRWGRRIAAARGRRANRRLRRLLQERCPETSVFYVSGTLAYGNRLEEETDEDTPLSPTSFAREYGRAEEPWVEAQLAGARVGILRPPWVMGWGSWLRANYVEPALRDGAVPLYGDGDNWMSFIDVADCGGAIVHLAGKARNGGVFNLFAPGQRARQKHFVEALGQHLGLPVQRWDSSRLATFRDPAVPEALTTSCPAATRHATPALGYGFIVPTVDEMIRRHVPVPQ